MIYCKKFNIIPTTTICLACEHCLPPNKRNDGRMCKNEVTHQSKTDALILHCKLLKYLRTTTITAKGMNIRINVFKKMIKFRTHHAAILEDVINDIYENDREYFDKNIATSAPFDSLRSLYKDEFKRDPKTITWDDMYNY